MLKTLFLLILCNIALADAPPAVQLGKTYSGDIDISEYWVSEKLDGIRARWTGTQLISRQGNPFHPPQAFIENLPATPLDGELWTTRNEFQTIASIVKDHVPDTQQWSRVKLMIFDLPTHAGDFTQRIKAMRKLIANTANPSLKMVKQYRLADHTALIKKLKEVEKLKGEGLMLQHQDNHYTQGRTNALLKVKSYQDAEATVIGYTAGKGKHQGKMGALKVVTTDGIKFKLGGGFTDLQRQNPPPMGSVVTYKYYGLTRSGKPRFASFLRVRGVKGEQAR